MEEHGVLTYASAIAFQVMTALIPLALVVLSIMGFLHLESVWSHNLGPQFKAQVSPQVYAVADDVVRRTLGREQGVVADPRPRLRRLAAVGGGAGDHGRVVGHLQ